MGNVNPKEILEWRRQHARKQQQEARAKAAAQVLQKANDAPGTDAPDWDKMIDEAMERIYVEEHLRDQTTLEGIAGPTSRVVHVILSAADHKALIAYAQRVSLKVSRQVGLDELCQALVRRSLA